MGTNEVFYAGLGYLDQNNNRFGYTDNTFWYLGEPRMFMIDPSNSRTIHVETYQWISSTVNHWISDNPAALSTQPTTNLDWIDFRYPKIIPGSGAPQLVHLNYLRVGRPDPNPIVIPPQYKQIFSASAYGISGVGFGYIDPIAMRRVGYTDGLFWYKGEPRLVRTAQLPPGARQIPAPPQGAPASSGVAYYQSGDGRIWVTGYQSVFQFMPYAALQSLVDRWIAEDANRHCDETTSAWFMCGFLYLGQTYWQSLGSWQLLPDEFALALRDCEANLDVMIRWLPGTRANLPTNPATGASSNLAVSLPRLGMQNSPPMQMGNGSLTNLLALSYLAQKQKRGKRKKRGKKS